MPLNTQVPEWLTEENQWYRQSGERSTQNLVQSMFEAKRLGMEQQQNRLLTAQRLLGLEQQQQSLDMGQVQLKNYAADSQSIPQWLQEHPTWQDRQEAVWPTAMSPQGQKMLNDVRLRDSQSVQQKVAVEGVKEFSNRVNELSKDDPIAAAQFAQYIGQPNISPTVLQALGVAEQAVGVRKQNEREEADMAAAARGDQTVTTVTDKGVTTKYEPPKPGASTANATPKTMTLDGGTVLTWIPGSKTVHVVNPSGKKNEYTPSVMNAISNGLKDADPRKKQIQDFLADMAAKQAVPKAPDTNQPPVAPSPSNQSTNSFQVGRFVVTPQ